MGRSLAHFQVRRHPAMSAGCHELIARGGAALVTSAEDVIEVALGSRERIGGNTGAQRFVSVDLQEQQVPRFVRQPICASPQQISRSQNFHRCGQRPRCICSNARGWSDRRLGVAQHRSWRHRQVYDGEIFVGWVDCGGVREHR